jgi:hypothetical protein
MTYKKERTKKNIPEVKMHMHLSPRCHHYVCCSDGLVLVVGWDVLVLMRRGDNLKVIIIKLNKEQKKKHT